MATFVATKAILAIQASTLAVEATEAGLSALATALTDLSNEITSANANIPGQEFFGGGTSNYSFGAAGGGAGNGIDYDSVALVWAQTINSAAQVIRTRIANDIKNDIEEIRVDIDTIAAKQTIIADKQTLMEQWLNRLKEMGENDGIHFKNPWEYLNIYSTLLFYQNENFNFDDALNKIIPNLSKIKTKVEEALKHRNALITTNDSP